MRPFSKVDDVHHLVDSFFSNDPYYPRPRSDSPLYQRFVLVTWPQIHRCRRTMQCFPRCFSVPSRQSRPNVMPYEHSSMVISISQRWSQHSSQNKPIGQRPLKKQVKQLCYKLLEFKPELVITEKGMVRFPIFFMHSLPIIPSFLVDLAYLFSQKIMASRMNGILCGLGFPRGFQRVK